MKIEKSKLVESITKSLSTDEITKDLSISLRTFWRLLKKYDLNEFYKSEKRKKKKILNMLNDPFFILDKRDVFRKDRLEMWKGALEKLKKMVLDGKVSYNDMFVNKKGQFCLYLEVYHSIFFPKMRVAYTIEQEKRKQIIENFCF